MSLLDALQRCTATTVQQRGRDYALRGRVTVEDVGANWLDATVHGSEPYPVSIGVDGDEIWVSCSCPYAAEGGDACKHVWAAAVVAAEQGLLPTTASPERMVAYWDDLTPSGRLSTDVHEAPPVDREQSWRTLLAPVLRSPHPITGRSYERIVYTIDRAQTFRSRTGLVVEIQRQKRKVDGKWGQPRPMRVSTSDIPELPDADDREILTQLRGAHSEELPAYGFYGEPGLSSSHVVPPILARSLVPRMCKSGRCLLRDGLNGSQTQLSWVDEEGWELCIEAETGGNGHAGGEGLTITGSLQRGDERIPLDAPQLLVKGGLAFVDGRVLPFEDFDAFRWIGVLREHGTIHVPEGEGDALVAAILEAPSRPRLSLPSHLRYEEVRVAPRPRIDIRPRDGREKASILDATTSFQYDELIVKADDPRPLVPQSGLRRVMVRDLDAERGAEERLLELGLRRNPEGYDRPPFSLRPAAALPAVVRELIAEDWHVVASGKQMRAASAFRVGITSGIDWLELGGGVQFGAESATIPELLAALQRGEESVVLDDGTMGVLPEEWLRRYVPVAAMGSVHEDHIRFRPNQTALLDALLAAQPEVSVDAAFEKARRAWAQFSGIKPVDAPSSFSGTLRGYQKEGLGWMRFLEGFGFGGCLADDMGLGKTVQVLALLEARRRKPRGRAAKPSLVVVPRSLVFNWKSEASRFTPRLRVLDYTGPGRKARRAEASDHHVMLTTYGTLRRDVQHLKEIEFDYVILDEAQAIKNAHTASAKAVRLLRAEHRLALSGTPIENHLGEIWSLFEFLNPGILGSGTAFQALQSVGDDGEEGRRLIARTLRPLILRRTKEKVASELPPKVEQSLYCELPPQQRRLYDELRAHYRAALTDRIEAAGLERSKILVIEALLRLRQAACHPGLVDRGRSGESSAKLDLLLGQLDAVLDEGHKALVFSQFTTLLGILRSRLDAKGTPYAYLDGRTRRRDQKVERFQTDPACKLFLISLKAGGLGLNLTEAEYVYLLDPWWNPAVEVQAIDRAHRIGQTRKVFAYRLIARDTVEERILELQRSKRDLAESIITADNAVIRQLDRDDLELLLS